MERTSFYKVIAVLLIVMSFVAAAQTVQLRVLRGNTDVVQAMAHEVLSEGWQVLDSLG